MAIYHDTEVFCLSINGAENFQYRPLLILTYMHMHIRMCVYIVTYISGPEIAVGHWPFSDQFQNLAKQK